MAQQGISTLDDNERELVLEALAKAASRHEVEARYLGGRMSARRHDDKAAAMRKLRYRLLDEERSFCAQMRATDNHIPTNS